MKNTGIKIKRINVVSIQLLWLGLVLNIIFPGLGSLTIGKLNPGIFQVALSMLSIFLMLLLNLTVGFIILTCSFIWSLITSVEALKQQKAYK